MDHELDRRQLLASGLAAAPLLLGRPPFGARAAAGEPLALVTADLESHIAVVSLARRQVVRRLRTAEGPRSIERAPGARAICGHADAGVVTLVEGAQPRVRRVLGGFGAPRYAAVHPRGTIAYVSDGGHGELAVIDLVAGRVRRRVEVGAGARHLGLHPAGTVLWVALGSSASQIAVVDLRDPLRPRLARTIRPPFLAHDIGFAPSGRRVWVTAGREPRIAVYPVGGGRPVRELRADRAPQHVSFGPGVAYVASGNGGSIRVHDRGDGAVRRRARVPIGSFNVQRGGAHVLSPSLGTGELAVLDVRGRVRATIPVAQAAHDACVL